MALPATDTFTRSDVNPAGGNWTAAPGAAAFQITSNQMQGSDSGNYNATYWNADSFNNDQYSKVTMAAIADGGPAIRIGGANRNYYFAKVKVIDTVGLFKIVSNVESQIGSDYSRTNVNGDIFEIRATGTTIKVFANSTEIISQVDTSLTSGSAGLACYGSADRFDNWEGGNVAGGTTPRTVQLTDSLAGGEIL